MTDKGTHMFIGQMFGETQNSMPRGHAQGLNVYFSALMKRWQWSAYGPHGGTHGTAPSEAEALERAKRALQTVASREQR